MRTTFKVSLDLERLTDRVVLSVNVVEPCIGSAPLGWKPVCMDTMTNPLDPVCDSDDSCSEPEPATDGAPILPANPPLPEARAVYAVASNREDESVGQPDAPEMIIAADASQIFTGTLEIDATASSRAEKGRFTPKSGVERESTDEELESRIPYYMQYDGPTRFKAEYTIVFKKDGTLDVSKSIVTFTTVYYTYRSYVTRKSSEVSDEDEMELIRLGRSVVRRGENAYIFSKPSLQKDGWRTLPIPITAAPVKDGKLLSFRFQADAWYGSRPDSIVDKGIVGEVDLVMGKANFTAKYQSTTSGVIATYVVMGTVKDKLQPEDSGS